MFLKPIIPIFANKTINVMSKLDNHSYFIMLVRGYHLDILSKDDIIEQFQIQKEDVPKALTILKDYERELESVDEDKEKEVSFEYSKKLFMLGKVGV